MCSPHPHLQIRHRRPDVALGPFRDLAGDGDGCAPPPREEGSENLVFRGLEPDRLETGLKAFGQTGHVEIGVGEALNTFAINESRKRGATTVDLTSRPSREAANRLYQRLGFVQRDTNVYRFTL